MSVEMIYETTTLGALVRSLREARGYSLTELGGKIGRNRITVWRIEVGAIFEPKPSTIASLAVALEVQPSLLHAAQMKDAGL
jgi:transcriptional regulator with XRE-family HTH domain